MSSDRRNSRDELPEYGVRNRSQHSRHIHRKDPESDELEPACNQKHIDAEFKDAHIPTLSVFQRFSLCQNPECFGEKPEAESDEKELIADGGQPQGHYERGDGPFPSAFPRIGVGAVLYEDRPDTPADERRLHHVVDIRISIETTDVYYVVEDGTHTTRQQYHEEDLLSDFEPAGWRWPTSRKPTYGLTRRCGVHDKMDLMTDGGIDRSTSETEQLSQKGTLATLPYIRRNFSLPHGHSATPIGLTVPSRRRFAAKKRPQERHVTMHRTTLSGCAIQRGIGRFPHGCTPHTIWIASPIGDHRSVAKDTDRPTGGNR